MPEHLVDMWDEAMTHVFETAEPRNLEFSINTPQGNRSFLLRLAPEFAADNKTVEYLLGVSTDITELKKAEEALLEAEVHKRDFYRKTILAATGGKLEVVEPQDILALQGDLIEKWRIVTAEDYTLTREQAVKLAGSCGLEADLLNGLTACAGEMLSNALKYAGGGEASLYRTDSSILFIVSDTGPGIDSVNVPDIAFVRGYTTAGTGGLGYKLIIACADKTYLATGSGGTIVAVEMRLSKLSPLQGIAHSDLSVGLG
ncbi:MAG: ATP-binding protein [Thermoplasmata archaeon]|nr:ATP-binding protein [Thermoplasmata archaeon]